MPIPIDENVLIIAITAIFGPLFVFLIKMIIQINKLDSKMDNLNDDLDELKEHAININAIQSELKIINMRIDTIEREYRKTAV